MRVSGPVFYCISLMLCTLVSANEVLRGRSLKNKSESRSKFYTDNFNVKANTFGDKQEFEGSYLVGLIIGFIVTSILMIFAFVVVTYDEIMRHRNYDKDVQDATDKLINVYKCSSDDIKRIEQEFKDKEENRGKRKDIEKERLELTEIN